MLRKINEYKHKMQCLGIQCYSKSTQTQLWPQQLQLIKSQKSKNTKQSNFVYIRPNFKKQKSKYQKLSLKSKSSINLQKSFQTIDQQELNQQQNQIHNQINCHSQRKCCGQNKQKSIQQTGIENRRDNKVQKIISNSKVSQENKELQSSRANYQNLSIKIKQTFSKVSNKKSQTTLQTPTHRNQEQFKYNTKNNFKKKKTSLFAVNYANDDCIYPKQIESVGRLSNSFTHQSFVLQRMQNQSNISVKQNIIGIPDMNYLLMNLSNTQQSSNSVNYHYSNLNSNESLKESLS